MHRREILIIILIFGICSQSIGQLQSNDSIAVQYEKNQPNLSKGKSFFSAEYLGLHGYYGTSAEVYSVDKNFFNKLLNNPEVPHVEIESAGYMGWMGLTRNDLFFSLSHAISNTDPVKNDSLSTKSTLKQNSFALRFGYNLIKNKVFVTSAYIGMRRSRLKHLTKSFNGKTTIEEYLVTPNIDLRVTQYSAMAGLNLTFQIYDFISFGGYFEYLLDLHKNPIIRTKGSRLSSNISNPMNNYVIGIGAGFYVGGIEDNRK